MLAGKKGASVTHTYSVACQELGNGQEFSQAWKISNVLSVEILKQWKCGTKNLIVSMYFSVKIFFLEKNLSFDLKSKKFLWLLFEF